MISLYPLLLYAGLGGGLLLLSGEMIPQLRPFRKPIVAAWLTLATLLWLTLPDAGLTILSVWSPGAVLGGQILLAMTPAVWWGGVALGFIFSGTAWIEASERRSSPPLSGILIFVALLVTWLALASGALLTTLAAWAVFDLVWCVAALTSGADGERVTLGLALHGISSLILWMVSLLIQRAGVSNLWWLMWPTPPMLTLLTVAAVIRIGLYPFQIVFPRGVTVNHSLGMVYLIGPLPGVALLYRVLLLPGAESTAAWLSGWGIVTLLWSGVMAWSTKGRPSLLWAGHALLAAVVAGGAVAGRPELLLAGALTWVAGGALLIFSRGHDPRAVAWSWPTWITFLFWIGVPPSPVGELYRSLWANVAWGWRLSLLVGLGLIGASFIDGVKRPAQGALTPPWWWLRIARGTGVTLILGVLFATALRSGGTAFAFSYSWLAFGLWLVGVACAALLALRGEPARVWLRHGAPVLDILDLQWFYRTLWRGAEHLLGFVRIAAEVVEGSGAMLWSLLVLLLILLVTVSR